MKKALITGILGQDGSYMAELLTKNGYEIHGIVKPDTENSRINWIKGIVPNVTIWKIDILSKLRLSHAIQRILPHEIYNFAGISNVFNAWDNLDKIFAINAQVPQHILELILEFDKSIKFFQASSCLIFGRDTSGFQNESTPTNPIYPYGITKLYADNMVKEFRKTFGIFACSGIFFPHESERRGEEFLTKKITTAVSKIKAGKQKMLKVGNVESSRDWGYAPDYMDAAYRIMQNNNAKDYVIGSGILTDTITFIEKCFDYVGLCFSDHIEFDQQLLRETDTEILKADISKIKQDIGWKPTTNINEIIKIMIDHARII